MKPKHLPHADSRPRPRRWLPKFKEWAALAKPKSVRYQDTWAFLAGGLAFNQEQHTSDLGTLEEDVIIPQTAAADATMVTFPAPDMVAEKKLRRDALSEEARYVLDIIFNGPVEVWDVIMSPKQGKISPRSIGRHLKAEGWPKDIVSNTLEELTSYVGEL